MPKRMELLSQKVSEAGEKLTNELENATLNVTSRVEQMRKRVSDGDRRHNNDRRRGSRDNLTAIKGG